MNIYNQFQFGLYENPEIQSLDPLLDLLRDNPFYDSFWNIEEEEELPELTE